MPTERRRPGPKPTISRASVGAAAAELGFTDMTLTSVAERLGVTHGALYGHIADRLDLTLAAAEHVLATLADPVVAADWQTFLTDEGMSVWRFFTAHPGMYDAVMATGRVPALLQQRLARLLEIMAGYGFDPEDALMALDMVFDLAADAARRTADFDRRQADDAEYAQKWSAELADPEAAEVGNAFGSAPEVFFGRKLQIVITGIAGEIAPSS